MENLKRMPMTFALFDIIYLLVYGQNNSVNPKKFNDIISANKSFRKYEANDSKNLVLYTLDRLNRELNAFKLRTENYFLINAIRYYDQKVFDARDIVKSFNDNYNSLIGDLFHGLKSFEYQCKICKNCTKNYQIFNIITCSIQKTFETKFKQQNQIQQEKKLNIIDCFKFEQIPISFTGNNKLFCEKCNEQNDGECTTKICVAPKILILFLDRGINNRFMCDVDFPNELDINEFLEEKGKNYKLIGVIEHLGQSGPGGHFIATCKHFDGKWYMFSDSYKKSIGNEYKGTGIPYLIFYEREN
jgi:ubiquitin C-terminal hydrolase